MGLLLALSARGVTTFCSYGEAYHKRFVATVQKAQATAPVKVDGLEWAGATDQAFGNCEWAENMILFGMSARLLSLDSPSLVTARLRKVWPKDSLRSSIGHQEWFDQLAAEFDGHTDRSCSVNQIPV